MAGKHMDDELRGQRGAKRAAQSADSHMEDEILDIEASDLWKEPSNLEAPPPRPGYVQRWVRCSVRSDADAGNLARAARRGWVPRKSETAPDFPAPTIKHGEFAGAIGSVDCILCERPVEVDRRERAIVQARNNRQMQATVSMLSEQEHRAMPFELENRTKVIRGERRPKAADDTGVGDN